MVVFGQSGYIRAKWLYSGKVVVFGKVDVFEQQFVVIGKEWLYSGKSRCNRANWLHSGKVVLFGQGGCFRGKVFLFGQSGCIRTKWLYS